MWLGFKRDALSAIDTQGKAYILNYMMSRICFKIIPRQGMDQRSERVVCREKQTGHELFISESGSLVHRDSLYYFLYFYIFFIFL